MGEPIPPLLRGLRRAFFPVIVADVPSAFETYSDKGKDRSAEKHYPVMSHAELAALPVANYAAPDARLFYWVTGPLIAKGLHVPIMQAWGFEPSAIFQVWLKPTGSAWDQGALFLDHENLWKMGMGHTSRQNCEYVVEGRRGNPPSRLSKSIRQVLVAPLREHSRKPDKFFENVEKYAAGPYLELFGRQRRIGWTVRGNEVGKFR